MVNIINDIRENATREEKRRLILSTVSLAVSVIALIVAIIALM